MSTLEQALKEKERLYQQQDAVAAEIERDISADNDSRFARLNQINQTIVRLAKEIEKLEREWARA